MRKVLDWLVELRCISKLQMSKRLREIVYRLIEGTLKIVFAKGEVGEGGREVLDRLVEASSEY